MKPETRRRSPMSGPRALARAHFPTPLGRGSAAGPCTRRLHAVAKRWLAVGLLLGALAPAVAQDDAATPSVDRYGDLVSILSGNLHIPANEYRHGTVFSIGGDIVVDGTVREAVVIAGSLTVRGQVRGQVVGVLSDITLDHAVVEDQLVNILGRLNVNDSDIGGQTVNFSIGGWFPGLTTLLLWGRLILIVIAFFVVLLLTALVPDRIRVLGEEAPARYVPAFFVGILGYLALLILFGLLSATVIGLPLAVFGFYVLKWLGIAGIFYAIGRGLGRAMGREPSLLGGVLIAFTLFAILRLAPTPLGLPGLLISSMLWTLFFLLVEVPAVGLIVLTRFGARGNGTAGLMTPAVRPGPPMPPVAAPPVAGGGAPPASPSSEEGTTGS